jgi:hypothetical protein
MCLHQVPKLWRRKDTIRDMDSQYVVPHLPCLFRAHTLHPAAVWIFCHPLFMAPFTSNLDMPSGCLGGMCSLTPPPPIPTGQCPQSSSSSPFFPHDTLRGGRLVASFGVLVAVSLTSGTYFSLSEFFFFRFRYGLCGHPSLYIRPRRTCNSLGWRPLERCSYPPPPPSPCDDPRPPPPTAIAESQWGEPCSEAFGTGAHVAGSISLWPVLLPLVGNC